MTGPTCAHCEHVVPVSQALTLTRLVDVICCTDCADTLIESDNGAVTICMVCQSEAESDLRKQLPPAGREMLEAMAGSLDEGAVRLGDLLTELARFEGEHVYSQLLTGGSQMEVERSLNRLEEVGQVLVRELIQVAELYRRLVGS